MLCLFFSATKNIKRAIPHLTYRYYITYQQAKKIRTTKTIIVWWCSWQWIGSADLTNFCRQGIQFRPLVTHVHLPGHICSPSSFKSYWEIATAFTSCQGEQAATKQTSIAGSNHSNVRQWCGATEEEICKGSVAREETNPIVIVIYTCITVSKIFTRFTSFCYALFGFPRINCTYFHVIPAWCEISENVRESVEKA